MELEKQQDQIPKKIYALLERRGYTHLRPSQIKSIKAGLFEDKNLLVCTPTASGKTLVAELAALNAIIHDRGKALYIVPLRALANEKTKAFKKDYPHLKVAVSTGELDGADKKLGGADWIVLTSEKLDSLLRHHTPWLKQVKTVVFDEVHLLNDPTRGPTLEIVISILRKMLPRLQLIGLSATIGNPKELAAWLGAELVQDDWRPIRLHKGIALEETVQYHS